MELETEIFFFENCAYSKTNFLRTRNPIGLYLAFAKLPHSIVVATPDYLP